MPLPIMFPPLFDPSRLPIMSPLCSPKSPPAYLSWFQVLTKYTVTVYIVCHLYKHDIVRYRTHTFLFPFNPFPLQTPPFFPTYL